MDMNPADWATIVQLSQFQAGFLARTSHELRSPLSTLMSLHQLILNDLCDSPEEERDCIRQAYEAANHLLKMLELVTYVSKLEAGLLPLDVETISLPSLLEDVRFLTHLQAANRNVNLDIEIPAEVSSETSSFSSDYRVLRQVLVCLVESSIATLSLGSIRLWCETNRIENYLCFNLVTTPPLSSWQDLQNLLTVEHPEQTPERLLDSLDHLRLTDPQSPNKFSSPPAFFSLQYSLMLCQILLERINGQLQLVAFEQENQAFCLQCRVEAIVS